MRLSIIEFGQYTYTSLSETYSSDSDRLWDQYESFVPIHRYWLYRLTFDISIPLLFSHCGGCLWNLTSSIPSQKNIQILSCHPIFCHQLSLYDWKSTFQHVFHLHSVRHQRLFHKCLLRCHQTHFHHIQQVEVTAYHHISGIWCQSEGNMKVWFSWSIRKCYGELWCSNLLHMILAYCTQSLHVDQCDLILMCF